MPLAVGTRIEPLPWEPAPPSTLRTSTGPIDWVLDRHVHLLQPPRRRRFASPKNAAHPRAPANGVRPGEAAPVKENRGPLPKGAGFSAAGPPF